jgi:phage terminase small subunit
MPVLKNARHERFAQELAKGKSATEATHAAGYADPRNSTRLTKNDEIRRRIDEIQGRAAQRVEVTLQSLMAEAEEARQLAMKIDQPSAAVSALTAKGKLAGLWVEKRESTVKHVDPASLDDRLLADIAASGSEGTDPAPDHPKVTH